MKMKVGNTDGAEGSEEEEGGRKNGDVAVRHPTDLSSSVPKLIRKDRSCSRSVPPASLNPPRDSSRGNTPILKVAGADLAS